MSRFTPGSCHALTVASVTLPTPVFIAGLALAVGAGYFAGAVIGPQTPERTIATVASYEPGTGELCLEGGSVTDMSGVDEDGRLCGTWSHGPGVRRPKAGDTFRFVTLDTEPSNGGKPLADLVIFGTVIE